MRLQVIKNAFVKGILWGSLLFLFLFFVATSLLRIPSIQTSLIQRVTTDLNDLTGFKFSIEYVNLNWFDVLKIEGLQITDTHDSIMIYVPEVKIDFSISSIFDKTYRKLDKVQVKNAEVYLYKYASNEAINITMFIDTLKARIANKRKVPFSIKEIEIENSLFSFKNHTNNTYYPGFDINDFKLAELSGTAFDFSIQSDTISFTTPGLKAVETRTNLPIKQLKVNFTIHQQEMILGNLEAKIGKSIIKDSIAFSYSKMSNLSYFIDSVDMYIKLDKSLIDSKDLSFFSKEFRDISDSYLISGIYNGNVTDFSVRNTDLSFGNGGRIRGTLIFSGLPVFEETFISVRLSQSFASYEDLEPYLGAAILDKLNGIDHYSFSGNFTGFITDFVAFGNFETNLGTLITDVNIKISNDNTSYVGKLTTIDFDLGTYAELDQIQKIDMTGEIKGNGLTLENADFVLVGEISRLGINNYDITNISTDARFASEVFEGSLSINDPFLKVEASGFVDLRERIDRINLAISIDTLEFEKLNITRLPAALTGSIDIDVTGLELDSLKGEVVMKNMFLTYDTAQLPIGNVHLVSTKEPGFNLFKVRSDFINLTMKGSYEYSWVYQDFSRLYKEYKLNIENDFQALNTYYNSPRINNKRPYDVDMDISIEDINPILQMFAPNNSLNKHITLEASYSNGFTSILQVNSNIDTLKLGQYTFIDNVIDINASKIADSSNVLASIYISSENQSLGDEASTQGLRAEAIWDRNNIDFNFMIEKENIDSYVDLYGSVVFLQDLTVIKFNNSDLQLLSIKWDIIPENTITIANKEIGFQEFGFRNKNESMVVNGAISEDPEQPLRLNLEKFQLSNFNPILSRPLEGISTGYFQIKDYYKELFFETDLQVDSLSVNGFMIGNLDNKTLWVNDQEKFDLVFEIDREGQKIIDVKGEYFPGIEKGLNLDAQLKNANVDIIEPFVNSYFSEFKGYIDGNFTVFGELLKPEFKGTGEVKEGSFKINYLNTSYAFTSDISMNGNSILLNNAQLTDINGNLAFINGAFRIDDVNNIYLDFDGNFTDFLMLNTSLKDNDLFYGNARGSGQLQIRGYPANLSIDVTATTSANTRMFIPLGGSSDVNTEEFIRFISFSEESQLVEEEQTIGTLKGLDFKLDLEMTRDAYIELIFDLTAGDIIRGRGNGHLNLNFDAQGEFTMFGDYTIEEGGYNFTLYNIVNKEFTILPNSTITWLGDPYGGNLDIEASYDLMSSVSPLLDTAYRNAPEIRRRYPTSVLLDLKGPLLSPIINFDITLDDYPNSFTYQGTTVNLETEMTAIKSEWEINQQELQKQVFSLIIMRKFAEKNINTGGSIGRSVSEFVSNQLSYWISQVDENLEINLDLGELSAESFNTFQMRLSYTFMEGRLRVTRDGGFTDPQNETNVASIIGDWSVEYMLTENGNLRIKLFQETNYNTLNQSSAYDYMAIQGGVSLLYTQSYDEISEIFRSARKKKQKAETESDPSTRLKKKNTHVDN